MPPNLNMIDKTTTGYIYYENELQAILSNLSSISKNNTIKSNEKLKKKKIEKDHATLLGFSTEGSENLKKLNETSKQSIDQITFFDNFQKLIEIIRIFLNNNNSYLEDLCVFNEENFSVFTKLPVTIIEIVIEALEGAKFGISEIKYGIQLMKLLACSDVLVQSFINLSGLEIIYNILLANAPSEIDLTDFSNLNEYKINSLEITTPIKILALELLYMLLSHRDVVSKFLGKIDKSKINISYLNLTEIKANKPDAPIIKSKYDNYSNSKLKKHKNSRSSSRDSKDSDKSNDSDNCLKQIKLKNGYQIVLSLVIIGRRQSQLNNLVQKIVKKVSLSLFYKELDKLVFEYLVKEKKEVESYFDSIPSITNITYIDKENKSINQDNSNLNSITSGFFPNVNLAKLSIILKKLYVYLQTRDIDYRKNETEEEQLWYSSNYPYHHFFSSCSKISKFFYNKLDVNFNLQGNLSINNNETGEFNNSLTNEIAKMLEQYNFITNVCTILNNRTFQKSKEFYYVSYQLKTIIVYLFNCNGGVNFFSKNYDKTMILLNTLNNLTDSLKVYGEMVSQKNMFSVSNNNLHPEYAFRDEAMTLAKVLIFKGEFVNSNNYQLNTKIHLLQLKYFIEENMKVSKSIFYILLFFSLFQNSMI
jgi:hypothetical protein